MSAGRLLQHFDQISEAPDAVPRLRRFILDLAVRGKLVEQDQNDEPAGGLLKRIEEERRKVFKEAVGKKTKSQPPILAEEIPIPNAQNVVFARLSVIARIEKGNTGIQKANPGRFPLVSLAAARASCDEYQFDANAAIIPLISSTGHGHASIKRLHYQEGQFALANILCAVIPFAPQVVSARFLYEYFCAYKEQLFVSKMIGTANVSLNIGKIAATPVPIISPTAQNRVYALMALCDELVTARAQRETRRDQLVASTLHGLNNGDDGPGSDSQPAFKESARFYFNHLPQLTTRPEHITQLRQTILILAVRGKLVAQDPRDEPAAELLKRIEFEKAKLIKEGTLRAQKVLPQITDDELCFDIPRAWAWARLGDICFVITDGAHHTPHYTHTGVPFLSVKDVSSGVMNFLNTRFISQEAHRELCRRCRPEEHNVLLTKVGTTGIAVAVNTSCEFSIFVSLALLKFPVSEISPAFLVHMLNSPFVRRQSAQNTQGIGNKNLVLRLIALFAIPLPPLPEQHRIVAKVDELMALCDELEAEIVKNAATSSQLLKVRLYQALSGDDPGKSRLVVTK